MKLSRPTSLLKNVNVSIGGGLCPLSFWTGEINGLGGKNQVAENHVPHLTSWRQLSPKSTRARRSLAVSPCRPSTLSYIHNSTVSCTWSPSMCGNHTAVSFVTSRRLGQQQQRGGTVPTLWHGNQSSQWQPAGKSEMGRFGESDF